MKNFYEILGVKEYDTREEIEKAYNEISSKWFSSNFEDKDDISLAELKYQELSMAYENLSTARKRIAYDKYMSSNSYKNGEDYEPAKFVPEVAKVTKEDMAMQSMILLTVLLKRFPTKSYGQWRIHLQQSSPLHPCRCCQDLP